MVSNVIFLVVNNVIKIGSLTACAIVVLIRISNKTRGFINVGMQRGLEQARMFDLIA